MSNLAIRLISAAVGIPILLFCVITGGAWLIGLVIALQVLLIREWRAMSEVAGVRANIFSSLIGVAGLDVWLIFFDVPWGVAVAVGGLFIALIVLVFSSVRRPMTEGGLTLLAIFYVALPIATWAPLRYLSDATRFGGLGTVGVLFAATWLCDSGAYFVGRFLGKHKLFPQASPNKTVEGAVGGLLFAALLLPVLKHLDFASPEATDYAAIPIIVGIFGQLGDLLESLMKREMQVKDASQLIPGHGGFLDRFDSLLISSPLFLAYLLLVRA